MTELRIPELSLVVLIGVSGSGKSTFAARHFAPTQVLSSDFCRGIVSDDENDQAATKDAFDVLDYIAGKRLARGLLTVVDATNVQQAARGSLVQVARDHDVLPVAIVLDVDTDTAIGRNETRADRDFGARVVRRQSGQLRKSLKHLKREGFRVVHVLQTDDEIEQATIVTERLRSDNRCEHGPFDVIGDVHGCRAELETLLTELGYELRRDDQGRPVGATPPPGRKAVYVGDLVDRGPDSPGVLRLVMGMVESGEALCVPGNHEAKLVRALRGKAPSPQHGLAETLDQLDAETDEFRQRVLEFCDSLVAHVVLDDGRLVVAHAGLKEAYHNRASGRVRAFALYGDTSGETDEFGLPVRYPWADDYRGAATVVYGHTPIPAPEWVNNTICIDTGCVFGGRLTALRYPERELVSVEADEQWYEPARPLDPANARDPNSLRIDDVLGDRVIETRRHGRVSVREQNAAAALEVMSRFAMPPDALLYLPPTMSPCATSPSGDVLEHPDQAFDYFRGEGVDRVMCEEKHMGSRAVALVRRDGSGALHTRTGRAFFGPEIAEPLLSGLAAAAASAGLWDELETDWLLLDAELMPWSLKALELIRSQYAGVAAAARDALPHVVGVLDAAEARGLEVGDLLTRTRGRLANAESFAAAYRRYCWPTEGLEGLRFAPFQLLASSGRTYEEQDHAWHLAIADRLVEASPTLIAPTGRVVVDLADAASCAAAAQWWDGLTSDGGEGMVVKPYANLVRGPKGLVQPGVKVRGPAYLRLIYGPDYLDHLDRLRGRNLRHKRSLALREYAVGLEGLERTAAGDPLWRVHQCVFGVLALESEPIDPRL
ncbi:polynucleotide kinase-phosphatase [Solicola gregarius]|uniref:Polynucleotide kinase-phosphatase n=1 Tax=Solicola gregarius TaxID=2908642 RepID=A0AA46YM41_9ACTN|nr:polynucleotide kinase-phosphatase [Solicola gregarius]UYM06161.1 polynucleotide kinase-phosphatase [Solicola gregarius]